MAMEIDVDENLVNEMAGMAGDDMLAEKEAEKELDPVDMINGDGSETGVRKKKEKKKKKVEAEAVESEVAEVAEDQPGEEPAAAEPFTSLDESTEPESPPPTQSEDEVKQSTLRWEAERIHEQNLTEARQEVSELAVRRAELEAELKSVKSEEKGAVKTLANLIHRGPLYPKPQSKIQEAVANAEGSAVEKIARYDSFHPEDAENQPGSGQVIQENENWKIIPTAQIIEGIKGMGAKKADAIIELAPTLGDLVELQAQAGIEHLPFAKVLPKGVGQAMADEIEERILNACKVRFVKGETKVEKSAEAPESVNQDEDQAESSSLDDEEAALSANDVELEYSDVDEALEAI